VASGIASTVPSAERAVTAGSPLTLAETISIEAAPYKESAFP
jgi:hypothetical protein